MDLTKLAINLGRIVKKVMKLEKLENRKKALKSQGGIKDDTRK